MFFGSDPEDNSSPPTSFDLNERRLNKKLLYRCLGILSFIVVCAPANGVLLVHLFKMQNTNTDDVKVTTTNGKNGTTRDFSNNANGTYEETNERGLGWLEILESQANEVYHIFDTQRKMMRFSIFS